jgi:hypothetical protein
MIKKSIIAPIFIYLIVIHASNEIDFQDFQSSHLKFFLPRLFFYLPTIFLFRWFKFVWFEIFVALVIAYIFRQTIFSLPVMLAFVLAKTKSNQSLDNSPLPERMP